MKHDLSLSSEQKAELREQFNKAVNEITGRIRVNACSFADE